MIPRLEKQHQYDVSPSLRLARLLASWGPPQTPRTITAHYRTEGFKGGLQLGPNDAKKRIFFQSGCILEVAE